MKNKILLSLSMFIVCVSAVKAEYTNGIFILNEDWFGHTSGSINYYNYDTEEVEYEVFKGANTEKYLGTTSQFAQLFGDKLYIVSKQNYGSNEFTGGRLIVADASTLTQLASLAELDGKDGRSFVGVDAKKGYVGTSGGIYVFDMENYKLGKCVESTSSTSGGLYSGQVGDMLRYCDGKVYAVVQNVGVVVINPATDCIENTIELPNVVSVFVTADGTLYASESGNNVYNFVKIDTSTLEIEKIDMPKGMSVQNQWGSWRSSSIACDINTNVVYFISSEYSKSISSYNFDTGELVEEFVTVPYGEKGEQMFYGTGLGIEPVTGQLVLTTTEAGYSTHFKRNWLHFVNVSTGDIENTVRLKDYYWFPAMLIFINKKSDVSSIETIGSNSSKVEYFNLQGVRVDNPQNGVFVKKQGNKVQKVVL